MEKEKKNLLLELAKQGYVLTGDSIYRTTPNFALQQVIEVVRAEKEALEENRKVKIRINL